MNNPISRPEVMRSDVPTFAPSKFDSTKEVEQERPNVGTAETRFSLRGSHERKTPIHRLPDLDVDVSLVIRRRVARQFSEEHVIKAQFRALADALCEKHQAISTYEGIFKGMPHIKGMRLAVGHVLANLNVLGSIDAVVDAYAPHVTKEQVKEAIAYAKDFLEEACAPTPPHVDG